MTRDECERLKDAVVEVCGNPRPDGDNGNGNGDDPLDDPAFDDSPPAVPDRFQPPELRSPLDRPIEEEFDPDQTIDPLTEGISGLWFPDVNVMYVSPRRSHHNDQLSVLDQRGMLDRLGDRFFPWVWDTVFIRDRPDRAELDFPRSAGGAFQYVSRNEIRPDYISSGDEADEGDVYAVVWTCQRLGVPGETTARVKFLPSDSQFQPGTQMALEFGVTRTDDRPLSDFYRELQFVGELPGALFDRPLDIVPPDTD